MFERLRKIRQEKNIKAREIAERIGLKTEGAYYKKETGSVPFTLTEGKAENATVMERTARI